MRRILLLALAVTLSGCTAVEAYLMTPFDGNEYQLITQIRVDANHFGTQCANPLLAQTNATQIANETDLFEKYSEQLPHNDDSYKASKALNEIAQGLSNRYQSGIPVNLTYCRIKYESIENSAKILQHVLGSRPR
jgi:uncharacterized protein YceK